MFVANDTASYLPAQRSSIYAGYGVIITFTGNVCMFLGLLGRYVPKVPVLWG